MKPIFLGLIVLAFFVAAAVTGAYIVKAPEAGRNAVPGISACPYCEYFPEWGHRTKVFKEENIGVYLCENCSRVWGPGSTEWLKAHPDTKEWADLLFSIFRPNHPSWEILSV